MNTTLLPLLHGLGYREKAQQRAIVKLLHASGAFGELPGVDGILSDKQAQAVLEAVTFPTAERAARWLHSQTQAHMLHPPGTEDYERAEKPLFVSARGELLGALKDAGMVEDVRPAHKHYTHVLVLGGMEGSVNARLNMLKQLWDEGVRFDKIHLLGSERRLVPEQEFISTIPSDKGETLSTEMQMMQARYYDKREQWPAELRHVPVFALNTPNHADGSRANTRDTLEAWVNAHPQPGRTLVISSQPYVHYQGAVAKAVLPAFFHAEAAGAGIEQVKISVAMDSLARQIDTAMPQLLKRLEHQKTPPPPKLVLLDPAQIQTDAETYQFRFGGDRNGVTHKGRQHAGHWDPILHGDPLLVHERADGTLFVADGHHRLDLAKRLNVQGAGPGRVAAQVLREADGYTAQDVKIIAAYKNIAHGQTDPLETAQVFKEAKSIDHPEWLPSLQMDKGNLRMSYSLSKLPDSALTYVARGDVPAEKGAMVAEAVSDPAQQETVMRLVSEKLRLRYDPAAQAFHAAMSMASWPPAITLPSLPVEPIAAVSDMLGQWAQMVRQQRAIAQSMALH